MEPQCRKMRDRLVAYADGELDAAARSAVETHLVTCADCSAELRGIEMLRQEVRLLPDIESALLDRQAIVRDARLRQTARRPRFLSRFRLTDLVTAGALTVAAAFAILIRSGRAPQRSSSVEVLTLAELDARARGTDLPGANLELGSINGGEGTFPREEIQ
jgi:anti-sigma factor RsiW